MTIRKGLRLSLLLLAFPLAIPASASAEGESEAKKKREAAIKLRDRIQQVAGKLQEIQKQVIAKRPDLVKKQKKMRGLIDGIMKKKGIDPEKEMSELMAMQGMLGNNELPADKKAKLRKELRKRGMALQAAHEAAMKDPAVMKAQESFRKEMEAAMTKVNPKAKKLLAEFYVLRKNMKGLLPPPGAR